jgi:DNA-damage-inducible protein D
MSDLEFGDENLSLVLFEESPVRRVRFNDEWYYSIVDVVATLLPDQKPRRYWGNLKNDLTTELSKKIIQLKLPNPIGKMRNTDCANRESISLAIQAIPSSKVEPFRKWLSTLSA